MPWGTTGTTETTDFQAELAERGQKREVRPAVTGWTIVGNPKEGDSFDYYDVRLDTNGRYECSCYSHAYGDVRRRRICGHVRDTIIWRKEHGDTARDGRLEVLAEDRIRQDRKESDTTRYGDAAVEETNHTVRGFDKRPVTRVHTRRRRDPNPIRLDPSDLGDPPLPTQFATFRPHQPPAVRAIIDAYDQGKSVVFLDAPPGSGKTLIAEVVRRLTATNSNHQTLYVCNNKSLQDQFAGDFPYAKVLKGRANYPTHDRPGLWPEVSAADCSKGKINQYPGCQNCPPIRGTDDGGGSWGGGQAVESLEDEMDHCDECHTVNDCDYLNARWTAESAPLSVFNTAYLLTVTNGPQMFRNRDLVICDEADQLESELMRHVEVVIGRHLRNTLNIDLPDEVGKMVSWTYWLKDEVLPKLRQERAKLSSKDRKQRRRKKSLRELTEKIGVILPHLDDDWVVDGYEDARKRQGSQERQTVRFRPVNVKDYAQDWLWQHGKKWLLMSATFISPALTAEELGLKDDQWATVTVKSTFLPERRPVFLDQHVGPVVRKTEETALPKLRAEIADITAQWADPSVSTT